MEKALVCSVPEEKKSTTVFGKFFEEVLKYHQLPSIRVNSSNQQELIDFPIQQVLLSGLWVVIQKIGAVHNLPLTNEAQIDQVAEHIDRLVCVGLRISYRTYEYAALTFNEKVVNLIKKAVDLGYHPSMDIDVHIWESLRDGNEAIFISAIRKASKKQNGSLAQLGQIPVALFFANLISKAREYITELNRLAIKFKQNNRVHAYDLPNNVELWFVEFDVTEEMNSWSRWLNPPNSSDSSDIEPVFWLENIAKELKKYFTILKIFSSFDFKPNLWPKIAEGYYVIEKIWLNTQILLSMIDAPAEAETISNIGQYRKAIGCLKKIKINQAVKKILLRLQKRLVNKLSSSEESLLKEIIISRVKHIQCHWPTDKFDYILLGEIFIFSAKDSLTCDSETALSIVISENSIELKTVENQGICVNSWLIENVFPAIKWEKLTSRDVEEILEAKVMSTSTLIQYFSRLPLAVQRTTAKQLIADEDLEAEGVNLFVNKRLIKLTPELVYKHVEKFSIEILENYLPKLLKTISCAKSETGKQTSYPLLWTILGLVTGQCAKSILDDVAWRDVLYNMLFEVKEEIKNNRFDLVKTVNKLYKKLGSTYYFLPLCVEIRGVVEPISDIIREGEVVEIAAWGKEPLVEHYLYGVSQTEIAKIFRTVSQEQAFRWTYAHHANVDERWESFNKFQLSLSRQQTRRSKK